VPRVISHLHSLSTAECPDGYEVSPDPEAPIPCVPHWTGILWYGRSDIPSTVASPLQITYEYPQSDASSGLRHGL